MKENKQSEQCVNSAKSRTRGLRPWKKGQSGNPKGRPALPSEIRDLIGEHARAIVLAQARKAEKGNTQAAECLLKRHTPTLIAAEVSGSMDHTIAGLSKTQLQKLLKGLKD